jgi:hypothetical protein
VVQYSVGPIITLEAELLQGNTWTGLVIRWIPWSRRYLRTTMQFPKMTMTFIQLELSNRGLKIMKVNFNIFPGQHNHQIWTSLNHSGHVWRLEWGTDSHFEYL